MLFTAILAAIVSATVGVYQKPSASDQRSPCPAFNVAANHGFIPRDGTTMVSIESLVSLFQELYSVDSYFMRDIFQQAAKMNIGDGAFINLVQLRTHGAIEHDVSMFRDDWNTTDSTGQILLDNYSVNEALVDEMIQFSQDGIVMADRDFVRFRRNRFRQCKANNQKLKFGPKEQLVAFGEVALLSKVIGAGNNPRIDQLRAFILEERLPYEEGWVKSSNLITKGSILGYALKLRLATPS